MRLRRIDVGRLPGGEGRFVLDDLSPGLNLIVGPNGSGKSSLCAALRKTLWPGCPAPAGTEVVSAWESDIGSLRAELGRDVAWQLDGADVPRPGLPPEHLASAYTLALRDLLDDDAASDRERAERVQVEMSGGFDLARLRSGLSRRSHGRREEQALIAAEKALRQLEGDRRALAREEDRLTGLREQAKQASQASREVARLERAGELAQKRQRREEVERALTELAAPAEQMQLLDGREGDQLEELDSDLEANGSARDAARAQLRDAEEARSDCGFPAQPPGDAQMADLRARARELHELTRRHADAEEAHRRAQAASRAAAEALGDDADPSALAGLDASAVDALSQWVTRAFELRSRRGYLSAELGPAGERAGGREPLADSAPTDSKATLESLRRAADLLRDWLAGPEPPRVSLTGRLALAAAGLLGLTLGVWLQPGLLALAGLDPPPVTLRGVALGPTELPGFAHASLVLGGLALGALVALVATSRRRVRARIELEERFAGIGLDGPERFEPAIVRAHLQGLDLQQAAAELARQVETHHEAVRRGLAELEGEEREIETEREVLRARLGADPGLGDLALADLLQRMKLWREAELRRAEAARAEQDLAEQRESLQSTLAKRLSDLEGLDPAADLRADAQLEDLAERSRRWALANKDRVAAQKSLDQLAHGRTSLEERRDQLLRRSGLVTPEQRARAGSILAERLAELPRYSELAEERRSLRGQIAELETKLADRPDLLEISEEGASQRREQAEQRSDREAEIAKEIGAIEEQIRSAAASNDLEEHALAVDDAREALRARHEELLLDLAGDLLIDAVEGEYARETRPAVLTAASDLLARFTRHRYRLTLDDREGATRWRAVESETERGLSLSQLSDGTRMQLLLAARLAFATHVEGALHPPVFLDEALTASDPDRFQAVAESLLELAASGRQIFYLTCNPADVAFWRAITDRLGVEPPRVLDLGALRSLAGGSPDLERLAPPPDVEPPRPDGATAEVYARRLNVPRPDPFAPIGALHLFHLLRDDLPLLHDVIARGRVDSVGPWRSLVESGAAVPLFGAEVCRRIEIAACAAELYFEAWRIGRGRPVSAEVLAASGAVSERFLDRLASLADELGGDAEALLEAIRDGSDERTKRFGARQREALEAYLETTGHLDPSAPISSEALRARALGGLLERFADPAGDGSSAEPLGDFRIEALHRLLDSLSAWTSAAALGAASEAEAGAPPEPSTA